MKQLSNEYGAGITSSLCMNCHYSSSFKIFPRKRMRTINKRRHISCRSHELWPPPIYVWTCLLIWVASLNKPTKKEGERGGGGEEEESFLELSGLITVNPCNVRPAHLVWWRSNARHATKVCTLHNRVGFFDSSHQNFEFTSNFSMLFLTDLLIQYVSQGNWLYRDQRQDVAPEMEGN